MALGESILGMHSIILSVQWVLGILAFLYVSVGEYIDGHSRLEWIQQNWPGVWRFMNNRAFRLCLLFFLIVIVITDASERLSVWLTPPLSANYFLPVPEINQVTVVYNSPQQPGESSIPRPQHSTPTAPLQPSKLLTWIPESLESDQANAPNEIKLTIQVKETLNPFNMDVQFSAPISIVSPLPTCSLVGRGPSMVSMGYSSDFRRANYQINSPPVTPTPVQCYFYAKTPFKISGVSLNR
jgi:hypothetical protein